MRIDAFRAVRPAAGREPEVASPPYDVVDRAQARDWVSARPRSFLRITRPDYAWGEEVGADPVRLAEEGRSTLDADLASGLLTQDETPGLFLYRLEKDGRAQTGLVGAFQTAEYEGGIIHRHESTLRRKEDERARHIQTLMAHTGPVFLMSPDLPGWETRVAELTATPPYFDFRSDAGVRHTGWRIADPGSWQACFADAPGYVADGHHRAAAAVRAAAALDAERGPGGPSRARFLGVVFPARELRILGYHRLVRDLAGQTPEAFRAALAEAFEVTEAADGTPSGPGDLRMVLEGRWYRLRPRTPAPADPVGGLDVSLVQDRILGPVLGVGDPRSDDRLVCVGGIHGPGALERAVAGGQAAVGFALHPVSADGLMAVCDAGRLMPPKSTWFEPKLMSGLWVHRIDD